MNQPVQKEQWEKDTIGYHMSMAKVVFGENSKAVAWLQKKADESPNGLNEKVVMPESQVTYLLYSIHTGEAK